MSSFSGGSMAGYLILVCGSNTLEYIETEEKEGIKRNDEWDESSCCLSALAIGYIFPAQSLVAGQTSLDSRDD